MAGTAYDATIKDAQGKVHAQGQVEFDSATAEPMPKAGGTFSANVTVADGAYIIHASNQAPADGVLAAGQFALWIDDTNGAAKLMCKGKQADGTVKSGSVNLT